MKKLLCVALACALLCLSCSSSFAATIKTTSTFAGTDPASEVYLTIIAEWEEATGHKAEDVSATSDEAWKAGILNDFAAGNEADVLFYFANTSDSEPILSRVVPVSEINMAYPEARLPETEALREKDGLVYAVPVRTYWEGLFVNVDLFEEYGVALPTDWEKLETAIAAFQAVDITPISVSLSDVPHYLMEFAILASGPPEDHQKRPKTVGELPESWVLGNELVGKLYQLGAFSDDVNTTTDSVALQEFRDKRAAMRVDGSWFANAIPREHWDTTIAMPFPAYAEDADPTAVIVGVSMGFYITRKAWDDPEARDAAVSFLTYLTSEESARRLGFLYGGELLRTSKEMIASANTLCRPMGDEMNSAMRREWYEAVPKIAAGTLDARAVMERAIEGGAFS